MKFFRDCNEISEMAQFHFDIRPDRILVVVARNDKLIALVDIAVGNITGLHQWACDGSEKTDEPQRYYRAA